MFAGRGFTHWITNLASGVIGTLPVGNGGTGKTSVTANSYLKGDGTSALVERTYAQVRTDLNLGSGATQDVVDTTTGAAPALTSADFNKLHVYSHASTAATYTLPAISVGAILEFCKTGTGKLTLQAPASVYIEDSAAAGTIYCSDAGIATIRVQAVSATRWVVREATNSWTTT